MPVTETKALDAPAKDDSPKSGSEPLSLDDNFTPSTPYVHKFRTEMCKNFMMYGKCKYGDEVSKTNTNSNLVTPFWEPFQITQIQITHEVFVFDLIYNHTEYLNSIQRFIRYNQILNKNDHIHKIN